MRRLPSPAVVKAAKTMNAARIFAKEGSTIPVLTIIHDLVGRMKGPYHRLVGRHTERYLSRAAKQAKQDVRRRILFIAAAGMDDYFSGLFHVKDAAKTFAKAAIEKKLKKGHITRLLHLYLTTLLVLSGSCRDRLLAAIGLDEAAWLKLWCDVFEYDGEDMEHFNRLLASFRESGTDSLVAAAAKSLAGELSGAGCGGLQVDADTLRSALSQDMSAILRTLDQEKGA